MKNFKLFLEGKKPEKQKPKGVLNVFDIDDTLFVTSSKVVVKKDGKIVRELKSNEYNSYKLKPGEQYDYGQFRSGEHFYNTAQPIDKMIERAQRAVGNQDEHSKSIIITARSDFVDKEPFLQKFRDHGFPIDKVHVERAGNLQKIMPSAKSHVAKGVILTTYIKSGNYSLIRMWDDHEANLDMLLKLGERHPEVEVQAFLVDKQGNTRRYR